MPHRQKIVAVVVCVICASTLSAISGSVTAQGDPTLLQVQAKHHHVNVWRQELSATKLIVISQLRQDIGFERSQTWKLQRNYGLSLTPTEFSEGKIIGIPHLRWQYNLWKGRHLAVQHYVQRIFLNHGYLPEAQARILGRWLTAKLYGWTGQEWSCLDELWGTKDGRTLESGWDVHADNPTSLAAGIPQADPGSKMASVGLNWQDSAYVQIVWGLHYIATNGNFSTPCEALNFRLMHGSY